MSIGACRVINKFKMIDTKQSWNDKKTHRLWTEEQNTKKDLKKYPVPCHPFYAGICPLYHIFAGKRFQEDWNCRDLTGVTVKFNKRLMWQSFFQREKNHTIKFVILMLKQNSYTKRNKSGTWRRKLTSIKLCKLSRCNYRNITASFNIRNLLLSTSKYLLLRFAQIYNWDGVTQQFKVCTGSSSISQITCRIRRIFTVSCVHHVSEFSSCTCIISVTHQVVGLTSSWFPLVFSWCFCPTV